MDKATSSVRFARTAGKKFAFSILAGLLSWSIFALSFLLILSLIAYKNADPTSLILPFSYTSVCVSALIPGFVAGKTRKKQGALIGLTSGAVIVFVMYIGALIMGGGRFSLPMLVLYGIVLSLAVLGGIIGTQQRSKKRRHHR